MKSMTGFGRASGTFEGLTLAVQVNSVNRKTLDLTTKIPDGWEALEAPVAEAVRKVATRGKVHVVFELTSPDGGDVAFDEASASTAYERLRSFAEKKGIPFQPSIEVLWQVLQSQRRGTQAPSIEGREAQVLAVLEEALRAFVAMREVEGGALLKDFLVRLKTLQENVGVIEGRAPFVAPAYREQLLKRLREAGLEIRLDDERVLKEIALFADRSDVTEEITRLRSHLVQFQALLTGNGEIGRKSEFLLQEIGREINTIGSKANDLVLTKTVIELKNELERIREQIANVE